MNKKFEKTKNWIKEHQEGLFVGAIVAGTIAVYGVCIVAAVKADKRALADYNELQQKLADAVSRGASVLPSPTGYWIIESNAS